MRYRKWIEVPGDPAKVFAYLADFSHTAEWDPGVVEARRLSDGPVSVGSRFELIATFRGKRHRFEYVITEYDEGRRVAARGAGDTALSDDTISVEGAGAGRTTVTYEADIHLKGARRLVAPLAAPLFRRLGDKALAGLQRKLHEPDGPNR